jgi:hypothetical protein
VLCYMSSSRVVGSGTNTVRFGEKSSEDTVKTGVLQITVLLGCVGCPALIDLGGVVVFRDSWRGAAAVLAFALPTWDSWEGTGKVWRGEITGGLLTRGFAIAQTTEIEQQSLLGGGQVPRGSLPNERPLYIEVRLQRASFVFMTTTKTRTREAYTTRRKYMAPRNTSTRTQKRRIDLCRLPYFD